MKEQLNPLYRKGKRARDWYGYGGVHKSYYIIWLDLEWAGIVDEAGPRSQATNAYQPSAILTIGFHVVVDLAQPTNWDVLCPKKPIF